MTNSNILKNGATWKVLLAVATALLAAGGILMKIKTNGQPHKGKARRVDSLSIQLEGAE